MAKNPNITELDPHQTIRQAFSEPDDSFRVILGAGLELAVALSSADGDSVISVSDSITAKASITNASTGVVIPAMSAIGIKSINLYCKTTSTITGSQAITAEVSPSDTDSVWVPLSLTLTPSLVNGTILMGTSVNIVARRVRVSIASSITSGSVDIYLCGQNN